MNWTRGARVSIRHQEMLRAAIREYGEDRAKNVARGAETPRLAALLTQKCAWGVIEAAKILDGQVPLGLNQVMDETVAKLDPDWEKHMRERWQARPADLSFGGAKVVP